MSFARQVKAKDAKLAPTRSMWAIMEKLRILLCFVIQIYLRRQIHAGLRSAGRAAWRVIAIKMQGSRQKGTHLAAGVWNWYQ